MYFSVGNADPMTNNINLPVCAHQARGNLFGGRRPSVLALTVSSVVRMSALRLDRLGAEFDGLCFPLGYRNTAML